MSEKIIPGTPEIGLQIRQRRQELGLTIEQAASRAEVGTKTWCRYEAGESIRREKSRGICKALNWYSFPGLEKPDGSGSVNRLREGKAWSSYLENSFGVRAAASFAAGSDILGAHIEEDRKALSAMPRGSHLGQLGVSVLREQLPDQFLPDYDYAFLYWMKCELLEMTERAHEGGAMTAYSVLQELILYLCWREADAFMELGAYPSSSEDPAGNGKEEWVFSLFGDRDLILYLYSGMYLRPDHPFHIKHWGDSQFHMPAVEQKSSLASLFV